MACFGVRLALCAAFAAAAGGARSGRGASASSASLESVLAASEAADAAADVDLAVAMETMAAQAAEVEQGADAGAGADADAGAEADADAGAGAAAGAGASARAGSAARWGYGARPFGRPGGTPRRGPWWMHGEGVSGVGAARLRLFAARASPPAITRPPQIVATAGGAWHYGAGDAELECSMCVNVMTRWISRLGDQFSRISVKSEGCVYN